MGRKKIDIERIDKDSARAVTFTKRRQGLFKKVSEFSRDFNVDLVFPKPGHAFECGDSVNVLRRFLGADPHLDHQSVESRPLFDDRAKTNNSVSAYTRLLNADVGKLSGSELNSYAGGLFALKSGLLSNRNNAFYSGNSYLPPRTFDSTEVSYLHPMTVDDDVSYLPLTTFDSNSSYFDMLADLEDLPLLDETILPMTITDTDDVSYFSMATYDDDDTSDASYLPTSTDFEGPPLEEKLLPIFTAEPMMEMSKYDDYVQTLAFGESHFFRHMDDLASCWST